MGYSVRGETIRPSNPSVLAAALQLAVTNGRALEQNEVNAGKNSKNKRKPAIWYGTVPY